MVESASFYNISVVVPVYQEESSIVPFIERLAPILEKISSQYEIIFCLDPSTDSTEAVIRQQIELNPRIKLITFSRRFGQPAATMAGILNCKGKTCVIMDVDLQDPPELIPNMYEKLSEGFDVAYATRRSRKGETWIRKIVTTLGYHVIAKLCDFKIPVKTGDFRMISRRVIEELRRLKEKHGFLKGLVSFVGFKQAQVFFDRDERAEGVSKYNRFTGSINIALNGIFCFGYKPIQFFSLCGGFILFISTLLIIIDVIKSLFGVHTGLGAYGIILSVAFFSGLQLLGIGVLGEYIGRIYEEVKGRPAYIIDEKVDIDSLENEGS